MDIEKLIDLVRGRKFLWDQRESKYHHRDVQRKLWKEVAEKMDLPVDEIKKRWRGVRDTFRKEYKKGSQSRSCDGADARYVSKSPYFNMLFFLKDIMTSRTLTGNVPDVNLDDDPSETQTQGFHMANSPEGEDFFEEDETIDAEKREAESKEVGTREEESICPQTSKQTLSKKSGAVKKIKIKKGQTSDYDEKFLGIEEKN